LRKPHWIGDAGSQEAAVIDHSVVAGEADLSQAAKIKA
jgi:hypothetical protein